MGSWERDGRHKRRGEKPRGRGEKQHYNFFNGKKKKKRERKSEWREVKERSGKREERCVNCHGSRRHEVASGPGCRVHSSQGKAD